MDEQDQSPGLTLYDASLRSGRKCGDCQLCCRLLPVRALDKKANVKCTHQRVGKGCTIYHHPAMPIECQMWSCRWLTNDGTEGLHRPDRSHYVIDVMPDMIRMTHTDGQPMDIAVLQVWVDPNYPDAHRDPALRAYLTVMAEKHHVPAVLRIGDGRSTLLVAPGLNSEGVWVEKVITHTDMGGSGNRFVDALRESRS